MLVITILLIVLQICSITACELHKTIVTTVSGKIQGTTLTSRLGKTIYAFRGMRYAQSPVGELRFQPPVPTKPWEGVYNATVDGPLCPQPGNVGIKKEDCLVVNVYSTQLPDATKNPKRPVIVFLHPGGFYSVGSASDWAGPQYFMDQDIVLVTFNYRLATLGFLSTGDKFAPGNNGLRDQIALLKWVKKHILAFGGDPNNITLMGYSAGAWSVIILMTSPLSRGQGLFHKAAVMSGGGPLGYYPLPREQLDIAKKQARLVGCPHDTSENIIKCLKTVSADRLGNTFTEMKEFGVDPILIWSPVIDGEVITDSPMSLIMKGQFDQIPIIVGQTKDEFGYLALNVIGNETLTNEMNNHFERVAPIAFLYERNTDYSRRLSKAIRKFYFGDKPIDASQLDKLALLYSDSLVGVGAHRTAKLFAQYSREPVYRYSFEFEGRYSHYYFPGTNNTKRWGVVHHDDLIYLFYISRIFPYFEKDSPQSEVNMVDKLTTLYANFAKTGKPIPHPCAKTDNVDWVPFTLQDQKYLKIDTTLTIKEKLHQERFGEWETYCTL